MLPYVNKKYIVLCSLYLLYVVLSCILAMEVVTLEPTYTVNQAADYLHRSAFTVREWLKAGKLKGAKIGKGWLIKQSDLEAFIAQHFKAERQAEG